MATQREIKNRIKSITNTKKITSTMERVATAKMKKIQQRLDRTKPYELKLNEIISNLMSSELAVSQDPHFREMENPSRVLILMITGNRGLCGSFNTHLINNTLSFKERLLVKDRDVLQYLVGKKGINYYNFIKEPIYQEMPNPEDKLSFEDAASLGRELRQLFLDGEIDEVYVSYTKVFSHSSQKPDIIKLLPITYTGEDLLDAVPAEIVDYLFEPDPKRIFEYLMPMYINVRVYTCFLETIFSEQFFRRVAMKNATDASSDMIRDLTVTYNRVRQTKITNEIAEIMGGATALE